MPQAGAAELVKQDSVDNLVVAVNHRCVLAAARAINTTTATDVYIQMFDTDDTTTVTLGTTTPDWIIHTTDVAADGDGLPPDGLVFKTGITLAGTTTELGSSTTTQHVRLCIL